MPLRAQQQRSTLLFFHISPSSQVSGNSQSTRNRGLTSLNEVQEQTKQTENDRDLWVLQGHSYSTLQGQHFLSLGEISPDSPSTLTTPRSLEKSGAVSHEPPRPSPQECYSTSCPDSWGGQSWGTCSTLTPGFPGDRPDLAMGTADVLLALSLGACCR